MTRRCPWKKRRPAPPPASSFVRGEHEFHIAGYSTASYAHYSILSGAFQVGGHTWALECGFNGNGHINSMFLELLTPYITDDTVVVKAGLRIEDPLGRCPAVEWQSEGAHTFTVWSGGSWQLSQTGGSRSWTLSVPDGFRGNESRYVRDDRLTILCTLDVLQKKDDDSDIDDIHKLLFLSSGTKSKSESDRMRHMLPDLTFVVEQTEIQAHRVLLAMRSPVFAVELLGDMRESTTRRVIVDDMRASTFRAMIRFIYTDELPIKSNTSDSESRSQRRPGKEKCAARRRIAMACDLLVAADRYDLEKLRVMCENILSESMDVASVMPTLMAVYGRHSCRQLEASCIEYLASDADAYAAVKATEEYEELEKNCYSFVVEVLNKVDTHKSADSSFDQGCKSGISQILWSNTKYVLSYLAQHSTLHIPTFNTTTSRPRQKKSHASASTYNTSEVVCGTLELRIPNFSCVHKSHCGGRRIDSHTLEIDGYDWKLFMYPGQNDTTKEWQISVFAELLTDPGTAGVRASACFRMDDPRGNSESTVQRCTQIFTRQLPCWGFHDFTTTKYAELHYLAHDGSLTIQCEIAVTNNGCVATCTATTPGFRSEIALAPPPNIDQHLKELLVSKKGSDVTFLVENREIHAHKLLIATGSPILYEVVRVANKENTVIQVSDMKAAIFEAVLHFVYTRELPPMDEIDLAAEDGVMIVGDIMAAACRFRLEGMKDKCETLLAESISKKNVVSMLELARHHNCLKLEDYCVQFISLPYVACEFSRFRLNKLLRI